MPATPRRTRFPGIANALAVCAAAFASGIAVPPAKVVSVWAAEKRIVAEESGSPHPGKWQNDRTPYLVEPMDVMSLAHPSREVTFKKSAQVAGTEAGLNLLGQIIDETPAPTMVVLPTIDEGKAYVRVKLQPMIDATPAVKAKVREQKSRDEEGSTTAFKRFRGGYLRITGANSSRGLQMMSVRVLVREEISEWPLDVDGRGDPMDLSQHRTDAWRGREKIINISTPALVGLCRVSDKYEASDQRRYFVPCPHCGFYQPLEWKYLFFPGKDGKETPAPEQAAYQCVDCGALIEHHHKLEMIAGGKWVARFPDDPHRQPGFYLNQLYSPFVPWSDIAQTFLAGKGDPRKEKAFTQQVLGEPYEEKGDAPDSAKLLERLDPYVMGGKMPPGVLLITSAIDVQADRLEFGVWGWGIGKTSWLLDKGILLGNTALPETWRQADELLARRYIDAHGRAWPIDRLAVDAGYNTQHVYAWARGKPNVLAVKGMPGHLAPALGTPKVMDVDLRGKKTRRGIRLWPVGTWPLKSEFYANLAKTIEGPDGYGNFKIGYVHLPQGLDEAYCKQLTAESLVTRTVKGRVSREWVASGRNEALDIRVYAAAAASHLGIDRFTPSRWQSLAIERGAPPESVQRDLESLWGTVAGAVNGEINTGADAAAADLSAPDEAADSEASAEGAASAPEPSTADRMLAEARRLLGMG